MLNPQESINNKFISALKANISFLKKNFPKNKNTDICQNSCNVVDIIENKLKTSPIDFVKTDNNLENFGKFIFDSNLFKKIYFDQISDNRHLITVKGCELAQKCVHPRLNPEKTICPIALLAGSFLKYNNPEAQIFVEPSKFTSQDSETNIILIN